MAGNRYSRDYRLTDTVDERGRILTQTEYIGPCFRFTDGEAHAHAVVRRMGILLLLEWLFFLLSLLPRSNASVTMYVMLPYLFSFLPLWLLSSSLWHLSRASDGMDRRTAENATDRLPACCLWTALLPSAGLLAELLRLVLSGRAPEKVDLLFSVCALAAALCGWMCFRLRKSIRIEKQ